MSFPKHQTVAWWIKQLKEMPPEAEVHIYESSIQPEPLCCLSISSSRDKNICYIDIGEENAD